MRKRTESNEAPGRILARVLADLEPKVEDSRRLQTLVATVFKLLYAWLNSKTCKPLLYREELCELSPDRCGR